ncbi:MAG: threonine/serine exporter family protein [[Clostridium] scindens]
MAAEQREENLLAYNMILSFLSEVIIILAVRMGLGSHPERIMIGIVMLLISGLSTTNGIREVLQRDFISGTLNIMNSMLGAAGIACGTALAMLLLNGVSAEGYVLNHNVQIQLISCTVACIGFAFWFKIRGRQVAYSGIGAFFTWGIYVVIYHFWPSNFLATLVAAVFVAFYAFIMSRINKAPSTIFLTASVFPLIPGPNLYYMMYGCVSRDYGMALGETIVLLATCLAIAFGFNIVDIASRTIMRILKREYHIGKNPQGRE